MGFRPDELRAQDGLVQVELTVEFEGETRDSSVCHMAFFSDPDGNALMLHRRYAPYGDGSQP